VGTFAFFAILAFGRWPAESRDRADADGQPRC